MTVALQAATEAGRKRENANLRSEQGLPLADKIAGYFLKPSAESKLRASKQTQQFRSLNKPWGVAGYVHPSRVGAIMANRRKHAELTRDEWAERYFEEVLPYASFYALAQRIYREMLPTEGRPQHRLQFILDALYTRIIIETDDGFQTEQLSIALLQDVFTQMGKPYIVEAAPNSFEGRYAVDVVAMENGTVVYGYQIKPDSFARVGDHMARDQSKNFARNRAFTETTGVPVYYLLKNALLAHRVELWDVDHMEAMCFPNLKAAA